MTKTGTYSIIKSSAICLLLSASASILFAALFSYLISNESLGVSSLKYIIPVIQFIASMTGAIYLCYSEKEKLLIKCIVQAGITILVMLMVAYFIFSGEIAINVIGIIAAVLGYIVTFLVHNQKKGRGNTRPYKYKNS